MYVECDDKDGVPVVGLPAAAPAARLNGQV